MGKIYTPVLSIIIIVLAAGTVQAAMLDPNEQSFNGQTREEMFSNLMDTLTSDDRVVTSFDDKMWVPWHSSSSQCTMETLKKGEGCNAHVDWEHNCMVTDEFSQMGILAAMDDNQQQMNQFYNTVHDIQSTFGELPAWRVYRNGNTIEACKEGINGNCDTASDASARIIIALYTAADNPEFTNGEHKEQYRAKATKLAYDMVEHEILEECKPSSLGQGDICYWLASGSHAKRGGMSSNSFTYTGYFGDAIIAMLQACGQTGDTKFCEVADDLTLNYLEAAKFNGNDFSTPPGRSFRWVNLDGIPRAECSQVCYPPMWDDADASRAIGMCQANYYADQIGWKLPLLEQYCDVWAERHMTSPYKAPMQYDPAGNAMNNFNSGYHPQGLQALFQAGGPTPELFSTTLDSALKHYTPNTNTWNYEQCFGLYNKAFALRALGFGLGRDEASFMSLGSDVERPSEPSGPISIPETGGNNEEPTQPEEPPEEQEQPEQPTQPEEQEEPTPPSTAAPPQLSNEGDKNLEIAIKPWYPKDNHYVFVCDAIGMEPTSIDWFFGDGDKQQHSNNEDVYHVYDSPGTYDVRCIARDDTRTWSTNAQINVA